MAYIAPRSLEESGPTNTTVLVLTQQS